MSHLYGSIHRFVSRHRLNTVVVILAIAIGTPWLLRAGSYVREGEIGTCVENIDLKEFRQARVPAPPGFYVISQCNGLLWEPIGKKASEIKKLLRSRPDLKSFYQGRIEYFVQNGLPGSGGPLRMGKYPTSENGEPDYSKEPLKVTEICQSAKKTTESYATCLVKTANDYNKQADEARKDLVARLLKVEKLFPEALKCPQYSPATKGECQGGLPKIACTAGTSISARGLFSLIDLSCDNWNFRILDILGSLETNCEKNNRLCMAAAEEVRRAAYAFSRIGEMSENSRILFEDFSNWSGLGDLKFVTWPHPLIAKPDQQHKGQTSSGGNSNEKEELSEKSSLYNLLCAVTGNDAFCDRKSDHSMNKGSTTGQVKAPSKIRRTQGKGRIPSLRNSDSSSASILVECVAAYQALPESERHFSKDEVCQAVVGTNIQPFSDELMFIMSKSYALHYFEVLRMEAISRLATSHRLLIGSAAEGGMPACKPFDLGLKNAAKLEDPKIEKTARMFATKEYLREVQKAAQRVIILRDEAERLSRVPQKILEEAHISSDNPEYPRAKKRIQEIERKIVEISGIFPFVTVTKDMASKFALADEARLSAVMVEARVELSKDIKNTINKFCDDSENGVPWKDLVTDQQLVESVLKTFPQFGIVENCALKELGEFQSTRLAAGYLAMAGCAAGAAIPGAQAAFAGICSAGLTYDAYRQYRLADEKLEWIGDCRSAGNSVCDDEELLAARAEYEGALSGLVATGVLSVIGDGPLLFKMLKQGAPAMKSHLLRKFADSMRSAKTAGDLKQLQKMVFSLTRGEEGIDDIVKTLVANNRPIEAVERVLGRPVIERDAITRVMVTELPGGMPETVTPALAQRQQRILLNAGFSKQDISAMSEAGLLPKYVTVGENLTAPPTIVNLKVKQFDSEVIKAMQTAARQGADVRGATSFKYVLDVEGHLYIVENDFIIPTVSNRPLIAKVELGTKKFDIVAVEAGTVEWNAKTSSASFNPKYGGAVTNEEIEKLVVDLQKKNPGTVFERIKRSEFRETKIIDCLDILSGDLTGNSFLLDQLITGNIVDGVVLVIQEAGGANRFGSVKGWEVFAADRIGGIATTAMKASVGKQLILSNTNYSASLFSRMAVGFSLVEVQNQANKVVLGGEQKKRVESLNQFNQAHFFLRIPVNQAIDKSILQKLPPWLFDACSKGRKIRAIVNPWSVRLIERGVSTFIYFGARKAYINE